MGARGPYKQGATRGLRSPGQPWKQIGPPNLYAARSECRCSRSLPDEDAICVMCGHNVSNASNAEKRMV